MRITVDGLQILQKCREHYPHTEVIVITGFATVESAIEAMKQGAYHYIAKPFRLDEVRKVVSEAWEKIRLRRENQQLRDQLEQFQGRVRIITQDTQLQRLLETARQIAGTDSWQPRTAVSNKRFKREIFDKIYIIV